ncbi:MAG: PIN domain-containing protein [Bifidobacteriaceae bacterium]|jgi:predicted nucleic acid-binding protein|nr:PIN domain-containing protein [Bifidobacteriaceae bacterium]
MSAAGPRWLIIDTSALVRTWRHPSVAETVGRLARERICAISPTTMLEIGYTAQSAEQWNRLRDAVSGLPVLEVTPEVVIRARSIQGALWNTGHVRAAGAADVLTAAIAIDAEAGVLHYDADFECIAAVSGLEQLWVAPRGSID